MLDKTVLDFSLIQTEFFATQLVCDMPCHSLWCVGACRGLSFPLNTSFVLSRHLSWSILNLSLDYKGKITWICIWVEAINYAFLICHVMWYWSLCQIVCVWFIQKDDYPCPVVGFFCCCFQLGYGICGSLSMSIECFFLPKWDFLNECT